MKCIEESSPTLSSSTQRLLKGACTSTSEDVHVTTVSLMSQRLRPAYSLEGLPALSSTPSSSSSSPSTSRGLSWYFDGLAAGDDLAELIRALRGSLLECCHDRPPVGKDAAHDAVGSSGAAAASETATASTSAATATHHVPRGTLTASQRRAYWTAAKAAFLFAAESPSAGEEATLLHCSPVTHAVLHPYYHRPHAAALPLAGALRGGELRMILSDARVVELARDEVRRNPKDGWRAALRLLQQVEPTPLTCAVELELYRTTHGQHWPEALRCLWAIPPAQWTEMDVAAALRCLFHAGRRVDASTSRAESHTSESLADVAAVEGDEAQPAESAKLSLARLIAQALRVHRAVEEGGTLQWSSPSALNDTLGLLGRDASAWQEACLLLDKVLAAQAPQRPLIASPASDSRVPSSGCDVDGEGMGVRLHSRSQQLYALVRPNAVTVHQLCRALGSQAAVGLRYVHLLQSAFPDTVRLLDDMAATEDVLRLCIAGQRWQEALQLVTQRQQHHHHHHYNQQERHSHASTFRVGEDTLSESAKESRSRVAPAQLPSQRQHYRPELFVQLVRLLSSAPAAHDAALRLIEQYGSTAGAVGASAAATVPATPRSVHSGLEASKHFNSDTVSRAYNCLLQSSATLEAADAIVHQLNHHHSATAARQSNDVARLCPTAVAALPSAATNTTCEAVEDSSDRLLGGLETESVAHIAYLSCLAGDWQRALHHTNALLHSPRYQATFLPTARLHDAVQYALEQAPLPGPSWRLSFQLFTDMLERNVPSSEVSFQSAVKKCFAGGASEEAQRLFYMVLKRGVRS